MIVFSREVYAVRCGTDVPEDDPEASDLARRAVLLPGTVADLADLDRQHHGIEHVNDFRARLAAGERWTVARLEGRIVHYFWLSTAPRCSYPSLPGCVYELSARTGYGHDAWTHPSLRGSGIRRRSFLHELRQLRGLGKEHEASFFVAYQLEGATRSLAKVGIVIEPLWRIDLQRDRSLTHEQLTDRVESMWPAAEAGRVIRHAESA
jgi:hypothetical protein